MIYTASFFQPSRHIGQLLSIDIFPPRGWTNVESLPLFVPTWKVQEQWMNKPDNDSFTKSYRQLIKRRWPRVKRWLDGLSPADDITLLIWLMPGGFSQADLVARLVGHHRPDCIYGAEMPKSA